MTVSGYIAIFVLLFCLLLTLLILKRLSDKGCFAFGYIFLIVLSVIALFLSTSKTIIDSLDYYILGEDYNGEIVNYKSYLEERKASDKSNIKIKVRMYVPIIEFKTDKNKILRLESGTHYSEIPKLGEKVMIAYNQKDNKILERNFSNYLLFLLCILFSIVFGFLTVGILKYAFGFAMESFKLQLVKGLILGFKFTLGLFTLLSFIPIYLFLIGKSSLSSGLMVIVLFICLILITLSYKFIIPKK